MRTTVGQIAIVQPKPGILHMGIFVYMIHPLGVEQRCPAFDAVDFVTFFQQEFGQVRTVLTSDAGDERAFHGSLEGMVSNLAG
jgi:hypothetical protein